MIGRCVLAVISVFLLRGVGLIFWGYATYSAVQLKQADSKYGIPALIVCGITLIAVAFAWIMRVRLVDQGSTA
ncbi:MAG: hypothetical protein KF812_05425 [Fimbriimonadaceae bacterium]|nr:hypothetical protein [Fimbriimonadaceae bacterium]